MLRPTLTFAFLALSLTVAYAKDRPVLEIIWPQPGAVIELGSDPEKAIGVVVKSNFALFPALKCAKNHRHQPILVDGKAVTALVTVTTKE
jgi:hypothetical protein